MSLHRSRHPFVSLAIVASFLIGLPVHAQVPYLPEKITGAEGSPVVDVAGNPLGPKWQFFSRNRYVTDSAWNNDESYFIIASSDKKGTSGFKALYDGATHAPIRILRGIYPNYRWSMNPATPNRLYAIPADTDYLLKYEISRIAPATGENESRISLPFRIAKDPQTKVNFAAVNGTEYAALLGSALPGADLGTYIHVVRIGNGETASVVASYRADESACGHPIEAKCKEPNPNAFYFSPDGRYVFLGYNLDKVTTRNGWRLFDVDIASGSIRPHVVPQIVSAKGKGYAKGFFNVNWGHPIFVAARGGDSSVVGTIYDFWDGQIVPEIRTVNAKYKTGKVIRFDVANNVFYSLTDPEGPSGAVTEAAFIHVSGTNYLNPGYVVASYDIKPRTAATSKFKGGLVAINVDAPSGQGTIEVVSHGSKADGCYDCQIFPNISPSGKELVYSTNGGSLSSPTASYVVRLPDAVRAPAPGSVSDFHTYQVPPLRSDLLVSSVSEAVAPTSTLAFTVRVKNAGPNKSFKSAANIRFSPLSPVAVVSVSDNCTVVPGGADCSLFTINPGATKAIKIRVRALSCPQAPYSFMTDLANEGTDTNMANNHSAYSPKKKMKCL